MSRVLVISNDFVRRSMAGPAIRSYELARQLQLAGNDVTLASRGETDLHERAFPIVSHEPVRLQALARASQEVLFQGHILDSYPFLVDSGACLVADLYGPFTLEVLVQRAAEAMPADAMGNPDEALRSLDDQLRLCDFFICASEKQFDYWVGALTALNRINSETFSRDPSMRALIDLVPFGLPGDPPKKRGKAMRGVIPGIGDGDLILLWGSSIYNWFDPLTLIRGVVEASAAHPNLRLVFMATQPPNPHIPKFRMLTQARELADELGATNRLVFFHEGWVPYDERADWLLDSDVGVSTHGDHLEARFSFRTRFLDYFWAALPILCTAGDSLGDAVEANEMGVTVSAGDAHAVALAIDRLADARYRAQCAERVRGYATNYTWSKAAQPLISFCANPQRAADLAAIAPARVKSVPLRDHVGVTPRRDWRSLSLKAIETVLYQGPSGVWRKGKSYLRRQRG